MEARENTPSMEPTSVPTKFCKHCGEKIHANAVICPKCGCQVEEMNKGAATPNIIINNANSNVNTNNGGAYGTPKSKWTAVLLCFFFGYLGAHKFYEGKVGIGILYLLTLGIGGIGVLIDFFTLLFKPTTYYV